MPEPASPIPAALTVGALLTQAARELKTRLDQQFATIGLTAQQAAVLLHVAHGNRNPRVLADLVGTDTASMTRLGDRLAAKGLIARSPSAVDRRSIDVSLTERGSALVPQIPPIFGTTSIELVAGLGDVEIEMLTHSLQRIRANMAG